MKTKWYRVLVMILLGINSIVYAMEETSKQGDKRKKEEEVLSEKKKQRMLLTVFVEAVKKGDTERIRFLVENRASMDGTDYYGTQAIHHAALRGHLDTVMFLVENGARVNAAESGGRQPIHWAASNGHLDTVRFLIENGANVDAALSWGGMQPIHFAAQHGHLDTVRFLVENGASVSAADKEGRQPILFAFKGVHLDTVRFLIENGGKFHGEPDWNTLLEKLSPRFGSSVPPTIKIHDCMVQVTISNLCRMAAGQGAQDVLKTILDDHRASLDESDIRQALIGAATAGHYTIVELLCDYVNRDHLADTLSHALARTSAQGHLDVAEYLMMQAVNNDDLFLVNRAGELMRKLLKPFSDSEIATDERLLTYNRSLRALAEQQRWCCIFQPTIRRSRSSVFSQEQAESLVPSHVRYIPEELWWNIINGLSRSNLYDIMS